MRKAFTTLIILSAFNQLKAQTLRGDSTYQLKPINITYQADKLTPCTFQNISGIDLKQKSTGQEPSFLLSETPSVTVYSDAGHTQGYSYFRMRGIDQTRINITLDGVPLNEPEDQGAYFSNYPDIFNSVDRIQIQRGVGTSKNGVASYGGSVQLFSPNLNDSIQATIGFGYGSFNSLRGFAEFKSGNNKNRALYVRISKIYSDGYKYHSSNNSQSVFISGGISNRKTSWKMNLLLGNQQNQLAWLGVADTLIEKDRRTNANSNEKDRFTQCLVQLQNFWYPTNYSKIHTSVYYTYLNGNYDFNLNTFLGLPSTDELYNYAFQSNLFGAFSNYTYAKKNLSWTIGIHGNIYGRQHTGSEKTLGRLYQNTGFKNEVSLFSRFNYNVKRLTFYADIQYRFATFNYEGSVLLNQMEWSFINPKAGLSYEFKNNFILYYSIGSSGREPTRNDIFGGSDNLLADSSGKPLTYITNPEFVFNQELGVRHQSKKIGFNLNLYYMDFKNEIVLDGKFGPNGLALTNNVDQSIRTGIELWVKYQFHKNFCLINNSSFNYSKIKEQTETFSPILTPPIIINQEFVYTNKWFLIGLSARYQDQSYIDFANTAIIKSYFLLNARIQGRYKGFELSFFLYNISNSSYYNNGYVDYDGSRKYFVQAPINFYSSLKYIF